MTILWSYLVSMIHFGGQSTAQIDDSAPAKYRDFGISERQYIDKNDRPLGDLQQEFIIQRQSMDSAAVSYGFYYQLPLNSKIKTCSCKIALSNNESF